MVQVPLPVLLLLLLVAATGCGASDDVEIPQTPPAPPEPICSAEEILLPDGRCIRPGVPVGGCSDGFEHDGVDRCEPVLPAEPCPPGLMAVPGDEECREVMSCGDSTWGDIPIDGSSEHVDGSYEGGDSDGTAARPWTTIQAAVDAAEPGAIVAVAAGRHAESVLLRDKPLQLWGRCPSMVEVVGDGEIDAAIRIVNNAGPVTVRGLAVTEARLGIYGATASQVEIDQVWIHDIELWGMRLLHTQATVRASLIEQTHELGIRTLGGQTTIDATEVRDTQPTATGDAGFGLVAEDGEAAVTRSLFLRNHCIHILAQGVALSMDGVAMRDARNARFSTDSKADGMQIAPSDNAPAIAEIRGSLVEGGEGGIYVMVSDATIHNTVVRDLSTGLGIGIYAHEGQRASAAIHGSVVERSADIGIAVYGSDAAIRSSRVSDTTPVVDWPYGYGVEAANLIAGPANVTISESLIERSVGPNVAIFGSKVTLDGTVIRDAQPSAGGIHSYGVAFQGHDAEPSNAQVSGCLVERSLAFGVAVLDSHATIHATQIVDTFPDVEGFFGDGISVEAIGGESSVTATSCHIANSARAGISNFDGAATLGDTTLTCQEFDLNGEGAFQFEDLGGSFCGCPEATAQCQLLSAGLSPPPPLDGG